MAKNNNVKDFTRDIADAIRLKTETQERINPQDFHDRILGITTGGYNIEQVVSGDECELHITDAKSSVSVKHLCKVIDYDGSVIKKEWVAEGDVFELPDFPQHDRLIAQAFSSPVPIDNNSVVVDKDLIIGITYTTASGMCEFDVVLTPATGLTVYVNLSGTKDWGDGNTNSQNGHVYADYGAYTIKWNGTSFDSGNFYDYGYNGVFNESLDQPEYSVVGVYLSDTVTEIKNAFGLNYGLREVTIPTSVTTIDETFSGINGENIETVIFPSGLTNVYASGNRLKNVVVPYGVTQCVIHSKLLKEVSLPSTIEELTLTSSLNKITLPESVKTLHLTDSSLTTLYLPTTLVAVDNISCSELQTLTIPNNITSLGTINCEKLQTLELLGGDDATKFNCPLVRDIKWTNNITTITKGSFQYLYDLKEIVFPNSIVSIEANCFYNECYGLTKVDFSKVATVPALGSNCFRMINKQLKIIVPDSLYEQWIVATNWSNLANYIVKVSEVSQ